MNDAEDYGRVLGIDPGTKRIGFALSDELGILARPLEVWIARTLDENIDHVVNLIERHDVVRVVVGVGYHLDGSSGPSAERALRLIEALARRVPDVPIEARDEALTTWEATLRLKAAGGRPKQIDAYAAAVILQEWLDLARPAPRPAVTEDF